MKKMLASFLVLAFVLSACQGIGQLTEKDPIVQYHALVTSYQEAQKAAANGNTCLALAFSEINTQAVLQNNYLTAEVEKTRAYREALATYGGQFADQQSQYSGVSPDQLDLAKLAQNNATPAQMGLTINAYVSTFTEAPLEGIPPEVLTNTQRIVSEKYNQSYMCIADWNDAVSIYNVERGKIPGDVVGTIAEKLGVSELPKTLPYFVIEAPAAPTVPTLAVP